MSRSSRENASRLLAVAYLILFGFLVFMPWEVIQTPFYDDATDDINMIVWYRVHCTFGDVGILLGAVGIVSAVRRDVGWILRPNRRQVAAVTFVGLAYTMVSEFMNVQIVLRWAYSPLMPSVGGIGLVPILQWILLPAAILALSARQARSYPYGGR